MNLLSIIIPVFNSEKYIRQCVDSVIGSSISHSEYEIIIIDDGSTDSSADIIRTQYDSFPNVFLIQQENKGVSKARMEGIRHAKGDYIWFIDSDDWILPHGLETVFSILGRRKDVDVIAFPLYWKYKDSTLDRIDLKNAIEIEDSGKTLLKNTALYVWPPQRFIVRRSLFDDEWLTFPEGIRHEDEFFGRVLLYYAEKVLITTKNIYIYRQWEGSFMSTVGIQSAYDVVNIYRHLMRFNTNRVLTEDQKWFGINSINFLLECYTKNERLYGTTAFRLFQKKERGFIWNEYKKYAKYFPWTKRASEILLIFMPRFQRAFMSNYYHIKELLSK